MKKKVFLNLGNCKKMDVRNKSIMHISLAERRNGLCCTTMVCVAKCTYTYIQLKQLLKCLKEDEMNPLKCWFERFYVSPGTTKFYMSFKIFFRLNVSCSLLINRFVS